MAWAAFVVPMYSDSMEYKAVMGCFPEESEIDVLSKKMYPEWDLRSLGLVASEASL